MRPLIVYYSHTGNNEKLALDLKNRLECDIHKISEVKKRKTISIIFDFLFKRKANLIKTNFTIKNYDCLIFVSPIWGGKIASPIRTFIEQDKKNLSKYFYITLCNGQLGQKEKIIEELYTVVQRKPDDVIELWINNLLPEEKKNKIKHTFNYQADNSDIKFFDKDIESFITSIIN